LLSTILVLLIKPLKFDLLEKSLTAQGEFRLFTHAQILTSLGIVLEFVSVFIISYRVFYPLKKEKRKAQFLEEKMRTFDEAISIDWKGVLSILFLAIGMLFQIVALFV